MMNQSEGAQKRALSDVVRLSMLLRDQLRLRSKDYNHYVNRLREQVALLDMLPVARVRLAKALQPELNAYHGPLRAAVDQMLAE